MLFPKYLAIKVNNVLLQQKKMIGRVELSNLEYKVHLKRSMQYKKIYQTEIILKVCIGKFSKKASSKNFNSLNTMPVNPNKSTQKQDQEKHQKIINRLISKEDEVETVNSVNSVSDNESDYLTENSKCESLMNNVKVNNTDNNKYESLSPYRRSLDTKLLHPNTIEEKDAIGLAYQSPNILTPVGGSRKNSSKHQYHIGYSKFNKGLSTNNSAAQSSRK